MSLENTIQNEFTASEIREAVLEYNFNACCDTDYLFNLIEWAHRDYKHDDYLHDFLAMELYRDRGFRIDQIMTNTDAEGA